LSGLSPAPQEPVVTGSLFILSVLQTWHYGERSVQVPGLSPAPQDPVITGSTIHSVRSSYNWFNYSFCLFFRLGIMVEGQFICLGSAHHLKNRLQLVQLFILFVLQAGYYGERSVQVPGLSPAPQEPVITGSTTHSVCCSGWVLW
jgi:hypothetical protein